jgi:hypothetical protein
MFKDGKENDQREEKHIIRDKCVKNMDVGIIPPTVGKNKKFKKILKQ